MTSTPALLSRILLTGDSQDVKEIGHLNLPTGKVLICDPFAFSIDEQELIFVKPGKYPVRVAYASNKDWGLRIAGAGVIFNNCEITRWKEANANPILIEHGLCSFMDSETAGLFIARLRNFVSRNASGNYYFDVLQAEFKLHANPGDPYDHGDYDLHYPIGDEVHNVAMFSSGIGDGLYSAHWGFDMEEQPVILVVDFDLVSE